jgi:pimeloyl-ACP methyl ester carboxylesterase
LAAVERAVRLALAEAGAELGDPLLPVGHSGGGIVAAALAGDPDLNVTTAVNLGGPVVSEALRDGATLLTIEHEEDLVPATGGWGHPSPDRLTVSRSVLEAGVEHDEAVPAHLLVRYQETAALMDASEEPRLVAMREEVAAFTGGGTGEMTRWVATRELGPSELSPSELSPSTPDAARGR